MKPILAGILLLAAAPAAWAQTSPSPAPAPSQPAGELGASCCRSLFVTAAGDALVAYTDAANRLCLERFASGAARPSEPLVVATDVAGRAGRRFAIWQSPTDELYACYLKSSGQHWVFPSICFRRLTPAEGGFTLSAESVVAAAGDSGGPQSVLSICRDADRRLWVGCNRWDLYHGGALQAIPSADDGRTWAAPQTLRIGTGDSGSGFLHLFTYAGRPRALCMGLDFVPAFESRREDGRWTPAVWRHEFGKGGGKVGWGEGVGYSLAADDAGRLHVLSAYYGGRVSYNLCGPDGTWQPFVALETLDAKQFGGLSLTTDGKRLWAVWSVAGKLRLANLLAGDDGQGEWSRPADVAIDAAAGVIHPHLPARVGPAAAARVPLAFESGGKIHLTRLALPAAGEPSRGMGDSGDGP